jgi:hypothetical protein
MAEKYKYGEGDTFVVRDQESINHAAKVIRCINRETPQKFQVLIQRESWDIHLDIMVSSTVKSIPLHNAIIEYQYRDALQMVNRESALRTDCRGNNALHILLEHHDNVVYKSMTLVDNKFEMGEIDTEIQQQFETLKAALLKCPFIETMENSSGETPGDMATSLKFKL